MDYLTSLLLSVLNTEPEDSADYVIARHLLDNIGQLSVYNATKIAELCQVSKAAVSRFCKYLGLEDFMDLQILCRNSERPTEIKFLYHGNSNSGNWIADYLDASIGILENLKKTIDPQILENLVTDIHEYPKAATFGHMQSGNVALNLQHDLTAANRMIFSSHKFSAQKQYIERVERDTVIVIFSASGKFFEHTFHADRKLNSPNRPKIYLVTVSDVRPKKYIDHIINLCSNYDYATSILAMQTYACLISLRYHERYN